MQEKSDVFGSAFSHDRSEKGLFYSLFAGLYVHCTKFFF